MGRLAGLLLRTVARTGHEAAYAYGQTQVTPTRRRKGSSEGCKPCEAAQRVDAAVQRFTGGGLPPGRAKGGSGRGLKKRPGATKKKRGLSR